MKTQASIHTLLGVALLGVSALTACPGPGGEDGGDGTDGTAGSSASDGADGTETDADGFQFPSEPFDAYAQIDRHGAVEAGTAGIAAPEGLGFNAGSDISIRDSYNASNPAEDAAGMWLGDIS